MSWNRIVSGLLAATYIVVALYYGGTEAGFKMAVFLVLPLACIWFSEAMGDYTRPPIWRGAIIIKSPGLFVRFFGWLLLVMPAIIEIMNGLTGSRP